MNDYYNWQKSYWNYAHIESNISSLSGHTLKGHIETLRLPCAISRKIKVLCIGVGTGKWVNDLADLVDCVWALDIVDTARLKLNPKVHFSFDYLLLPTDYFDLAMSLWVTPHISLDDLQVQSLHVIRSLKRGGLYAMHYNEPTGEISDKYDKVNIFQAGSSHRTKEEIESVFVDRVTHIHIREQAEYNLNMIVAHVYKH